MSGLGNDGDVTRNPMADLVNTGSPTAGDGAAAAPGDSKAEAAARVEPEQPSAADLLARQPLPADSAELHRFFKQSLALRIETPMNLHQAAAYACLQDEEATLARKLGLLLTSVLLVALQMRVLHGMVRANWAAGASACSSNYDCVGHPGGGSLGPKFCSFYHFHTDGKTSSVTGAVWSELSDDERAAHWETGLNEGIYRTHDYQGNPNEFGQHLMSSEMGECSPCANHYLVVTDTFIDDTVVYLDGVYTGSDPQNPEPQNGPDGERWARLADVPCDHCTNYSGFNRTDFSCELNDFICTQCWDPTTRKFAREEKKHVHGLDKHRYTTLVLTSGVIAANLVSELRDVVLSGITARDGYAKSAKGPAEKAFAVVLFLVKWTRQFAFCPGLLLVIPMVIMASGADVMALCFNTVAVLFILQVDNQLFEFGLPEAMRREFELQGKVELSRADEQLLSLTKLVHLVGIPLMTLLFMAAAQYDPDGLIIILTAAAPWACAGFVALLQPAEGCQQRSMRFAQAMAMGFSGILLMIQVLIIG